MECHPAHRSDALPAEAAALPDRDQRQALGRRLRAVLRCAGWDDRPAAPAGTADPHAALLRDLDVIVADGAVASWRRVVAHIWQDEVVRQECDRDHGLRALLRRHATRTRDQALTALLASQLRRADAISLIGAVDGRLWIADSCWEAMPYHLEIPDHGVGGVAAAPLQASWLAARGGHARAVLHHPRLLGGLPASGIAWPPARGDDSLLPLRQALAVTATPGPFLIRPQADLLAWTQPTIHDPAVIATIQHERAAGNAWKAYAGHEPLLALRQEAPGAAPLLALHAVVVRLLSEGQARGHSAEGSCEAALGIMQDCPETGRSASLTVWREPDHLLVPAERFSRLPCALGWLPQRYQPDIGACDWRWSDLARCGWQAMIAPGPWRLQETPPPLRGRYAGAWLALPLPGA